MDPTSYHIGDVAALSTVAFVGGICLASGRFDELLLFVLVSTVYGLVVTLKIEQVGIQSTLERLHNEPTDVAGDFVKWTGQRRLEHESEGVVVASTLMALTLSLSLIAKRTLERYSPALCTLLYCACLSMLLKDRAMEHAPVTVVALGCMILLSLTSNHILRLHIAAAIFCVCLVVVSELKENGVNATLESFGGSHMREVVPVDLGNPLALSFCLVVGFGACLVHDVVVFFILDTALKLFHMAYILLTSLVFVDAVIEVLSGKSSPEAFATLRYKMKEWHGSPSNARLNVTGRIHLSSLTWSDALGTLKKENMRNPSYETLVCLAPLFCVYFALTMVARRLISPSVAWRADRFKEAVGTALGACCGFALLVAATDDEEMRRFGTSPVLLTILSALLYLQISRITDTSIRAAKWKGSHWFTMGYWQDAFPQDEESTSVRTAGKLSTSPPPFVLLPEEDVRVRHLLKDLNKQSAQYRIVAQELRQSISQMEKNRAKADVSTLMNLASQHVGVVKASVKASDLAEKVALQLRELASDAETEREILEHVQDYTRAQKTKHDHHMVIKRQTDNATATFKWLNASLGNSEAHAERLLDTAQTDIRNAAQMLVKASFGVAALPNQKNQPARAELEKLVQELKQISEPVFDGRTVDLLFSIFAKKLGSNNRSGGGAVLGGESSAQHQQLDSTTPFTIAMESKKLPFADEVKVSHTEKRSRIPKTSPSNASQKSGGSSVNLSESQRRKKRWWGMFSTSKRKSKKGALDSQQGQSSFSSLASPASRNSTPKSQS